tara:strand:+ start:534 stop:722 length:189 start_codon:yes stop_codon:yes gene_type:complete
MNIEIGDMIIGPRDYGIIVNVKNEEATVHWFDKKSSDNSTLKYSVNQLKTAIDGVHSELIKG